MVRNIFKIVSIIFCAIVTAPKPFQVLPDKQREAILLIFIGALIGYALEFVVRKLENFFEK